MPRPVHSFSVPESPVSNVVLNWAKRVTVGGQTRKAVLLLLADYADDKGRAWPSQETVATILEMSERTVRSAIKELVEAGVLVRKPRWRPDGTRGTDILRFDMEMINRNELPVMPQQPANDDRTTGKSRQNNRQMVPRLPAGVSGDPLQEPQQKNPKQNGSEANASGGVAAQSEMTTVLSALDLLWYEGKPMLIEMGLAPKLSGDMIGQWLVRYRDAAKILDAIRSARQRGGDKPIAIIVALLEGSSGRDGSGQKRRPRGMVGVLAADYGGLH